MAKNPLFELSEAGTSVWLDYIRRSLITSGELQRMIEEERDVGQTSNTTIFEKAIGGSSDYDEALRNLIDGNNTSDEEIMLSLIVEDIKLAADVLKPVYEQTKHKDGYVSIEVLPRVADDTPGTIAMAHDLFDRVGRPNIFVKIPATDAGLPAIEQCIADGLNINITLMFSVKVYEDVARAFIRGLQRRMKDGHPVDIASVASFFVSRVDTAVDKLLEQKIAAATDPAQRARLQRPASTWTRLVPTAASMASSCSPIRSTSCSRRSRTRSGSCSRDRWARMRRSWGHSRTPSARSSSNWSRRRSRAGSRKKMPI